jgi:hypothetical protein
MSSQEAEPSASGDTSTHFPTGSASKYRMRPRSLRLRAEVDLDKALRLASDLEDADILLGWSSTQ